MKHEPDLEVEVKAGETLYLEMVLLPGNWRGGGRLVPVSADDAKTALLKLQPLDRKSDAGISPRGDAQAGSPTPSDAPSNTLANITIKSVPPGADIDVDGKFMGSTPSTIQLTPGEHLISIEMDEMKEWQRTMTVTSGGNVTISATLEKP
jgi:hypothetical protein